MLGDWPESLVELVFGFNKGTVLDFWYGKVLAKLVGVLVGL